MKFIGRGPVSTLKMATLLMSMIFLSSACATGPRTGDDPWPRAAVLPQAPPQDLDTAAATSTLRLGSDGFWYAVGGFDQGVVTGTPFLGRYSGEWPLRDVPRPVMVYGHVLKTFDDGVALVHLAKRMPDAEPAELEVTWESWPMVEGPGKGIGVISDLDQTNFSEVTIALGTEQGVQRGDLYAVLRPPMEGTSPQSVQLSRRLVGLCLVREMESTGATCRMWRGHPTHQLRVNPQVGDEAIFMEATFGKAPREGRILVSTVEGPSELGERLRGGIAHYVDDFPNANVSVEVSELQVDARDVDFHRYHRELDDEGQPTIFVGGSVHSVDGVPHLFVNYTGVGVPVGPGMVAAPPEMGIDMGPVDGLNEARLRSLPGLLMSAVMVYRGQTSEALMHLNSFLGDPGVEGPIRWHARDQYAMRWGALGNYEEAFWLVLEDEAVASGDERARLNAVGTRVRLYDFLDLQDQALALAAEYLEDREDERPSSSYLSARSMFAEMAIQAGDEAAARLSLNELHELCPEGCNMDLLSYMAALYWASGPDHAEFQDELVAAMIEVSRTHGDAADMGSVRMYQGWSMMRDSNLEQALIAFLEAQRLFVEAEHVHGQTRARYFIFLTQLARSEPQEAFEHGLAALEQYTAFGDFEGAARVYDRMIHLYGDIDLSGPPRPYLGAARRVLAAAAQIQMARGDYAKASEALFTTGSFLFRIGNVEEAQAMFQQTVWFGVQAARFDVVALSHLYLGVIARAQGDMDLFREEITRARLMAKTADEPEIMELIENTVRPPEVEEDVPTKLL
ncbi:MAG: tetratricopeptide repeat protein [Bradymonadaceae bacterium]